MSRKEKFFEKLMKAMDKHGYRPAPRYITRLEQLPEEFFEKALDCTDYFTKGPASPETTVPDEKLEKK